MSVKLTQLELEEVLSKLQDNTDLESDSLNDLVCARVIEKIEKEIYLMKIVERNKRRK
jgi:hypothetical protein